MKRTLVLLFALLMPAAAQAGETEVGGAVILVDGAHTEQTQPIGAYSQATAHFIPAPFLMLDHRAGRLAFHLESIPPLGTVPVAQNALGLNGVELTYLGADVRYSLNPRTSLFIGETIFNQQTRYVQNYGTQSGVGGVYVTGSTQFDRSRVVGAQYGIIETLAENARSSLVATLGFNPRLTANLGQQANYALSDGSSTSTQWFSTPEAGSEVDMSLMHRTFKGRSTFAYGLRYLNMTMRFADGSLADRNAFLIPFVGVSTRLGR